jgi:hypothetical protein
MLAHVLVAFFVLLPPILALGEPGTVRRVARFLDLPSATLQPVRLERSFAVCFGRQTIFRREKITIKVFLSGRNDRGVTPQTVILEASRRYVFARQLQGRELIQNDKVPAKFLDQEPSGTAADGKHRIARPRSDFVEGSRLPRVLGRPDSDHFRHGMDRAWRNRATGPVSVKIREARRSKIYGA